MAASGAAQADHRQLHGYAYAVASYTFWGVAPVYFVWVKFAAPLEVLAHRVLWSVPLLILLVTVARQWPALRALQQREVLRLAICAVLLSINWLTFIYAIHIERIAETSLGYFINPLVSIVLGALFLNERMRAWQWVAAGCAAVGVSAEVVAMGELPWLGLTLAFSFGFYGLLRKQLSVPSSVGLAVEAAMVLPFALVYLVYAGSQDLAAERSAKELLLLGLGGLVTITPLIWFASAAVRIPLTTLSFFQYLAPTISLLLAVYVYGEAISGGRWLSFMLIWLGLVLFSLEGVWWHRRRADPSMGMSD